MEIDKVIYYTDKAEAQEYIQKSIVMGYRVVDESPADPKNTGGKAYKVIYKLEPQFQTVELLSSINGKLTFFTVILVLAILGQILALFMR